MRYTHDDTGAPVPDPGAVPSVDEIHQDQVAPVAVPVRPDGPVETHELPSRSAPAWATTLTGTLQHILGADLKRKRAVLVADEAWSYAHSASAPGVRWPADVPLVITHADSVYASNRPGGNTATLTVISEVWAD